MTTTQIAVRLPADLVDQLDHLVPAAHASRSEAIRRAIELYVYRLSAERDASAYDRVPLTEAEQALVEDSDGWSDVPRW